MRPTSYHEGFFELFDETNDKYCKQYLAEDPKMFDNDAKACAKSRDIEKTVVWKMWLKMSPTPYELDLTRENPMIVEKIDLPTVQYKSFRGTLPLLLCEKYMRILKLSK